MVNKDDNYILKMWEEDRYEILTTQERIRLIDILGEKNAKK